MKNKLLKSLVLVISLVMIITILVSCGEKKNTEESNVTVKIGAMTGPTAMGILQLKDGSLKDKARNTYEYVIETEANTIAAKLISGSLDICIVPVNLASKLYNNPAVDVKVIDISVGAVLSVLSGDTSITDFSKLAGKTVLVPNQGTMPDAVVLYLKGKYNIDFTITYGTPASIQQELIADPSKIGVLPQPAATATTIASAASTSEVKVKQLFALKTSYDSISTDGSELITGVTIVRSEFLEKHKSQVDKFILDHKDSALLANSDVDSTAKLVVQNGILPKEPVAIKAIPNCSICCITGNEMKTKISGLISALQSVIPELTGNVPNDNFYYLG